MIFIDEYLKVILHPFFGFDSYSYGEVMAIGMGGLGWMSAVFCFFGGIVGGGEEGRVIVFGFLLFIHCIISLKITDNINNKR